jgi:hypothetical protein
VLTVNSRDADQQHPLAYYVHPLHALAKATGESVRLIYNGHAVEIRPDDESGSVAYDTWHVTYMTSRQRR